MLVIREAVESDLEQIRDVFMATYGKTYPYPQFYDPLLLKKMIFADDTLLLVAEDTSKHRVVGTASVVLQVGAWADLIGEFGRLAVHPDFRGHHAGSRLMEGRLKRVENRLHLGLVENRVAHPYSQKISHAHGFAALGFIPQKLRLTHRENIALYGRHFCNALQLRRNRPRVIPEVYCLANLSLSNCGISPGAIVDDEAASYPAEDCFELEELSADGYATLLRIERGRVRNREIFGPMRLHYGLFQLQAKHSTYLIAREGDHIVGAIGFIIDDIEKNVRVFELISLTEYPIRFLLRELSRKCREELGTEFVEVDVSADAPRMQRTLVELGFLPVAYIPAMVFHDVERIDAVKFVRLLVPFTPGENQLHETARPFADIVSRSFEARELQPRVMEAIPHVALFRGLNAEQTARLAAVCGVDTFHAGDHLVRQNEADGRLYILLSGETQVTVGADDHVVGTLHPGECVGEASLLRSGPHAATSTAISVVEAAVLTQGDLYQLIRQRPDIGVTIYRNIASGLREKLKRLDAKIATSDHN